MKFKTILFLLFMFVVGCVLTDVNDNQINNRKSKEITVIKMTDKSNSRKDNKMIQIRFIFVQVNINTHTYEVLIDNISTFKDQFLDDTGGHKPFQKIINIKRGKHIVEVRFKEKNSSVKIEKDFSKNIGFKIIPCNDNYKDLKIDEFPFDKIFYID